MIDPTNYMHAHTCHLGSSDIRKLTQRPPESRELKVLGYWLKCCHMVAQASTPEVGVRLAFRSLDLHIVKDALLNIIGDLGNGGILNVEETSSKQKQVEG